MANNLEEVLKKIPELLREREEELEKREKEFQRQKLAFEKENPNNGEPSDILHLDVGGKHISVLRRTLTQVEDSMLASRFSGRWDDSLEKTKDGRFFIDQPIELFAPLINYLRSLASATPLTGPPNSPTFDTGRMRLDFARMTEYYGMSPGVFPICIYQLEAKGRRHVASHPHLSIESKDFQTYCLEPQKGVGGKDLHDRAIESFELKLGPHGVAQIGWMEKGEATGPFLLHEGGGQGAGYAVKSAALDIVRSSIVDHAHGESRNVTDLSIAEVGEGSVIRCSKRGKLWFIDGLCVAKSGEEEIDTPDSPSAVTIPHDFGFRNPVPCISLKGSFEITGIELSFL